MHISNHPGQIFFLKSLANICCTGDDTSWSFLQDRSCKATTFSGSERFYFHCVNLLLSASRQLWLIKQTSLFFFLFTQSCIPQIFTILGEARDANAPSIQSSQQTSLFGEIFHFSPTLNLMQASAKQNWLINHKRSAECRSLRWKSRSLFSVRRTINDIVTYVGGTLKNILSQFHKGNCQLCTPAPPRGMMGLCPSVSNTVFFHSWCIPKLL